MVIKNDSPLRRLPSDLNMKQTLFLDAIRYSVEMADVAHIRLRETLLSLTSEFRSRRKAVNVGSAGLNAMLDAWSLVDSIHRLRMLLKHMPFVKQKSPGLVSFYKQTTGIDDLRNAIQHILLNSLRVYVHQ